MQLVIWYWDGSQKFYKSTIPDVKTDIQKLKQSGVKVEIPSTPGHSDIKGNEYGDRLAKGTTEEAKVMKDLPQVLTMSDIKTAVREFGRKKWQDMWEKSDKDIHLFSYRSGLITK